MSSTLIEEETVQPLMPKLVEMIDLDETPHVIVAGDPIGGFSIHGPFVNYYSAMVQAEWQFKDEKNYWLTPVHPPASPVATEPVSE